MGKSSYTDLFMGRLLSYLFSKGNFDLSKPVLIIGSGYGAGVSELLALGAKLIYLNDLSNENLSCAKRFINKKIPQKSDRILYLPGDITQQSVLKNIPDDTIGFIYVKNVIQALDANQLLRLIKASHQKLVVNGLLFFVFENPVLDQQIEMVKEINSEFEISKKGGEKISLDEVVRKYYMKDKKCSIRAYDNTPRSLRKNGFPCIIYNKNTFVNLLIPSQIKTLLKENGFNEIAYRTIPNHEETIILHARKKGPALVD